MSIDITKKMLLIIYFPVIVIIVDNYINLEIKET